MRKNCYSYGFCPNYLPVRVFSHLTPGHPQRVLHQSRSFNAPYVKILTWTSIESGHVHYSQNYGRANTRNLCPMCYSDWRQDPGLPVPCIYDHSVTVTLLIVSGDSGKLRCPTKSRPKNSNHSVLISIYSLNNLLGLQDWRQRHLSVII